MEDTTQTLQDILGIVTHIKDNAVSKEEFYEFKQQTEKNFDDIKQELSAMRFEINDIKQTLQNISDQSMGDSTQQATDIVLLTERISLLEKQIKNMQRAHK
ncbi:MAG: hypothetical protein COU33_03260 [Candidatus Magasanikbacteria bacterium CG10_big_fil_rev_8_21_14_0_10_43_6]|uniref:Uncharacterized protein n=1 Tax=Candidatus Magasanikbacteria bacterium CG10_big_fil_rev_8_21_14_0_10_43_6 TaxID=1974650 RepID=A0A2M6W0U7_9BACT|nr:MAG: hypothetical protein COU33_03260 [Candidatus Magasanikbacteria bacterium CG10_big_fil_rev_8_21_14_0_10_43_6]